MDSFEFSYSLTPQDFARATRVYTARQPAVLISLIGSGFLTVITTLIVIAGAIMYAIRDESATEFPYLFCLLPCIGAYLYVPFTTLVLRPSLTARNVRKNPDSVGQVTWILDEERLQINAPRAKNELQWSLFGKVVETKQYYLLIYSANKGVFHIVPKSGFESPEQDAEFRRCIEQYVGPIK